MLLYILFPFIFFSFCVYCDIYQFYPIGTCNVTCATCSSQQYPNVCLSCEAGLEPNNGSCIANAASTIYYQQYFMNNQLSTNTTSFEGWSLYSITETISLAKNNTQGCINTQPASYFYFEVIGLYKSDYRLLKTISFTNKIQSLQVFFRVLFFTSPMLFTVTFDDVTVLSSNISQSNFTNTWNFTSTSPTTQAINCSMFTYTTSSLNYKKLSSSVYSIQTRDVYVKFSAEYSNNSDVAYWGIRQVVFIGVKCASCPSDAIKNAAATTGIVIGVLIGLLTLLIIPIIVIEKLYIKQILQRKRNIKARWDNKKSKEQDLIVPKMIARILKSPIIPPG